MDTKQHHAVPPERLAGKPWSVAQAAEFLGISTRTLWRLIDARDVKVTRLGRRVLVPDSEVRRLAGEVGK
jgi:excisionase family DNA binding protein